jgi:hypothetical protein
MPNSLGPKIVAVLSGENRWVNPQRIEGSNGPAL